MLTVVKASETENAELVRETMKEIIVVIATPSSLCFWQHHPPLQIPDSPPPKYKSWPVHFRQRFISARYITEKRYGFSNLTPMFVNCVRI